MTDLFHQAYSALHIQLICDLAAQSSSKGLCGSMDRVISSLFSKKPVFLHQVEYGSSDEPVCSLAEKTGFLSSNSLQALIETRVYTEGDLKFIALGSEERLIQYLAMDNGLDMTDMYFLHACARIFNDLYNQLSHRRTDALTGLYNRFAFDELVPQLQHEKDSQRRSNDDNQSTDLCLALIDIDHFKRVNDDFGHLFGDEVLILVSEMMRTTFRSQDMLFRYGGEEFAVILKGVGPEQAQLVLDRFRETVAQREFPQIGHVYVSIGFTEMDDIMPLVKCFANADSALYYVKENGRNQVMSYSYLVREGIMAEKKPPDESDVDLF